MDTVELDKPSLHELEDRLKPGCLLIMNDGSYLYVSKYNEARHQVYFLDGEKADLFVIYDSIKAVSFLNERDGLPSIVGYEYIALTVIKYIQKACKYHVYFDTILAYLKGYEDHYIFDWCRDGEHFGKFPSVDSEKMRFALDVLIEIRLVKEHKKGNKIYYTVRPDGKKYPKRH